MTISRSKILKNFGGKHYARIMAHETKSTAQEHARLLRKEGWLARVMREGKKDARFPWVVLRRRP